MSEDENHFLSRMKNEAAQYYDSGHAMVDTDDLRQLVRIASRWPHAQRALNKIDDGPGGGEIIDLSDYRMRLAA